MTIATRERDPAITSLTYCVILVIWLTVFCSFTLPGRDQLGPARFDSVAILKMLARALSIALLGWCIFSHIQKKKTQTLITTFAPWLLFGVWAALSTAWSPLRSVTLGQAGGQFVLILLGLSIAFSYEESMETYLFHGILAVLAYCAFYGLGSFLLPDVFNILRSSDKSIVHPTALGGAASLGIIMTVSLLVATDWRWVKTLALIALPLFLVALVAAQNRTAYGLTVLIASALLITQGRTYVLAAFGLFFAAAGTIYMLVDPGLVLIETMVGSSLEIVNRGQSTVELTELSGRDEMWTKMWASYLESPLLGHGYFVCSKTGTLLVWFEDMNHTAHNLILQAMVSTGVVGLVIFLTWLIKLAQMTWVNHSARQKMNHADFSAMRLEVNTFSVAILCWFLGWSMLNSSVLGPLRPESAVFALTVGILVGQYHIIRTKRHSLNRQPGLR